MLSAMNNPRRVRPAIGLLVVVFGAGVASAQAPTPARSPQPSPAATSTAVENPLQPDAGAPRPAVASSPGSPDAFGPLDAIGGAIKQDPNLAAALTDLRGARATVTGEEHRYGVVWGADLGYTKTQNPNLGLNGVMVPVTDQADISTDLRRQFASGTNVALTVAARRFTARSYLGFPPQAFELGPGYGASAKLEVTQPLLRGAGTDIGLALLHQAEAQLGQTRAAAHQTTCNNLSAVLNAYWDLVYARESLQIQRDSLALAERQRADAQARVDTGTLSPAELTSFETRIAQLSADLASAEVDVEARSLEVQRLSGVDPTTRRLEQPGAMTGEEVPVLTEFLRSAKSRSYDLEQAQANLTFARVQAKSVGDSLRPRLDVNAWLQVQGLGNREIPPALTQMREFDAVSAHVGVRYESPIDSTQRRMQLETARLAVVAAEQRLSGVERKVISTVTAAHARSRTAARRIELASHTVALAEKQLEARRALFQTGSSTALEVREAEESVRASRLSELRARIDALEGLAELDRVSGRLGEAFIDAQR